MKTIQQWMCEACGKWMVPLDEPRRWECPECGKTRTRRNRRKKTANMSTERCRQSLSEVKSEESKSPKPCTPFDPCTERTMKILAENLAIALGEAIAQYERAGHGATGLVAGWREALAALRLGEVIEVVEPIRNPAPRGPHEHSPS